MDAKRFLEEARRMCKAQKGCDDCPIRYNQNACLFDKIPDDWASEEIGRIVPIVEKWSQEHPQKTRLQDFLEKYPNAPLDDTGIPIVSPISLGYCKGTEHCSECRYRDATAGWCWEQEAKEDG